MSLNKLASAIAERSAVMDHLDRNKWRYLTGLSTAGLLGGAAAYGDAALGETADQLKRNFLSVGAGLGTAAAVSAPLAMLEGRAGMLGTGAKQLLRTGTKGFAGVTALGTLAAMQYMNKKHNESDPLFRRPDGFLDPITKHPLWGEQELF
jgi:hypothetical protein